ncbi:MAG: hypothetical protein C5B47_01670 [Verrucomicrobia bacterium]|nr:MAG: hypothetical protein C5B47_01670 [Verrucomicrobiota bacterium]
MATAFPQIQTLIFMKILCNQMTQAYGLDGLFPKITQDYYNAHNIEDQETDSVIQPTKCEEEDETILKSAHSRNQATVVTEFLQRLHRFKRSVSQETSSEESLATGIPTRPLSREAKQRVLTALHACLRSAHRVANSHTFSPQEKEDIRHIVFGRALGTIHPTVRSVSNATTQEQVTNLLRDLIEKVRDIIQSIQNVVLPPLAENFESQSKSIWLDTASFPMELEELDAEDSVSQDFRTKVLTYIQTVVSDIDRFKSLESGNLTLEFAGRIKLGFDERKRLFLEASRQIQVATTGNREIETILKNLRTSVMNELKKEKFTPIFLSPQLCYLRNHAFFQAPSKLQEAQAYLGA